MNPELLAAAEFVAFFALTAFIICERKTLTFLIICRKNLIPFVEPEPSRIVLISVSVSLIIVSHKLIISSLVGIVLTVFLGIFSITSGDATGLKVQYSGLGANASVYYGESSVDRLTIYIDDILSSSNSLISDRLTRLNKDLVS